MQQIFDQFYKSERARYSNLLSLSYTDDYPHRIYKDFDKSLALLNEIFELSETQAGRGQIMKIDSNILGYHLLEPLRTEWHWRLPGYKKVDNAILRIMVNLVADLRFYDDTDRVKSEIKSIRGVCNPTWNRLSALILQSISQADKRIKIETPLRQYKTSFLTKEQAIAELHKHEDFYNFSGRAIHFQDQYQSYIDMLRGALRVGARSEVIHVFPKNCFGCVLFSMVNTGYRVRRQRHAITFLKELTDGWFTQDLFECILIQMKNLYRKLKCNHNFEDRYELVCLRFTQYDRNIYEYFSKIGHKLDKGILGKSKQIRSMNMFQRELDKLRYKQRLSQQRSEIKRKYRDMSRKCSTFLEISKIVNTQQAAFIKQFVVAKMKILGYTFQKIILQYEHSLSMEKFRLKQFVDCSQYHSIVLARCKSGKIIGGYFTYPSTYRNLKGTVELFTLEPNQRFDFGQVTSRYQIIAQKQKNKKNLNEMQPKNRFQEQQLLQLLRKFQNGQEEYEYQKRKYLKQRRQQEDYYNRRRRYEDDRGRQRLDITQEQLSSEEEQKANEPEKISHHLNFKIDNQVFRMLLSVKEENKQLASVSWKNLMASLPESVIRGETYAQVQIDRFQFYKIEGQKDKSL